MEAGSGEGPEGQTGGNNTHLALNAAWWMERKKQRGPCPPAFAESFTHSVIQQTLIEVLGWARHRHWGYSGEQR